VAESFGILDTVVDDGSGKEDEVPEGIGGVFLLVHQGVFFFLYQHIIK
jgi:hypothetical protein